jgi:hypothetical protein
MNMGPAPPWPVRGRLGIFGTALAFCPDRYRGPLRNCNENFASTSNGGPAVRVQPVGDFVEYGGFPIRCSRLVFPRIAS